MIGLCDNCALKYADCKGDKSLEKTRCDYYKKPVVMNVKELAEKVAELEIENERLRRITEAPTADAVQGWVPLSHDDDGLGTDFPYERDGEWVIVTDGETISVERIKKDAYDHFYPNGTWFELEDVIAWMPLPEPYKDGGTK